MKKNFKKVATVLLAFFLGITGANAQSLQEVVYLKNGSIIRGTVIEQKPNESIKIQTADGSVFVYAINEVSKITKEAPITQTTNSTIETDTSYGWNRTPRYRGFIGDSYVLGVGDYAEDREFAYTSHGVQIVPDLYVGAGVGVNYWFDSECWSVPVFMHVRGELHKAFRKNVSPYIDAKVGYSLADVKGVFCNPSVGCHFYFGHSNVGLSVGIGYVVQAFKDFYDEEHNAGGVSLNLALDF